MKTGSLLTILLAAVVMSAGAYAASAGKDPADVSEGRVDVLEFGASHVNGSVVFEIVVRESPVFNATETASFMFYLQSAQPDHPINVTLHVEFRGGGRAAYVNASNWTLWLGEDNVTVEGQTVRASVPDEVFAGFLPGLYRMHVVAVYREEATGLTLRDTTESVLTRISASESPQGEESPNPLEPYMLVCCIPCGVIFVILLFAAAWVAMDAHDRGNEPLLWFLVALFLPILGLILYLLIRDSEKKG